MRAPFLQPEMLQGVARIAEAMRPYGVRVGLSSTLQARRRLAVLRLTIRWTRR